MHDKIGFRVWSMKGIKRKKKEKKQEQLSVLWRKRPLRRKEGHWLKATYASLFLVANVKWNSGNYMEPEIARGTRK